MRYSSDGDVPSIKAIPPEDFPMSFLHRRLYGAALPLCQSLISGGFTQNPFTPTVAPRQRVASGRMADAWKFSLAALLACLFTSQALAGFTTSVTVGTPSTFSPTTASAGVSTFFSVSGTFTDSTGNAAAPFTGTVNWGDATSNAVTVTGSANPFGYSFIGSHTYAFTGTYSVTITILDHNGGSGNSAPAPPGGLAVSAATPTITTTQQPASATAGTSIADKATVSGGSNPTGSVTFNLYNNSTGAGTPLFTSANVPLSGGTATSTDYTAAAAGTFYWVATYNGDSNNNAVTSGTALEPVIVSPAAASQLGITQQPSATATAGVAFTTQPVVAEEDIYHNVITTDSSSTVTVARGSQGTASLQGSSLTVTLVNGVANFSGLSYDRAETMNLSFTTSAAGVTSAASNDIVVTPAPTSIAVGSISNVSYNAASQPLTLSATVSGPPTVNEGTVTFTVTIGGSVQIGTSVTSGTVSGGSASAIFTLPAGLALGTYSVSATYNAGPDFTGSSTNTPQTFQVVKPTPTLTSIASSAITLGSGSQTLSDTAVLAGGYNETGSLTFTLTLGSTQVYTTSPTVSGNGAYTGSYTLPTTGKVTGTYTWSVSYGGDGNNNATTDQGGAAEQTVVSPASPSIGTSQQPASANLGSSLADKATLSGGYNPTGTVTFNLYNNSTGTGTPLFTDTEPLSGGPATSAGYTTTAIGTNYWVATYSGDSNNNSVTSGAASEPVTVTPASTSIAVGSISNVYYNVASQPVLLSATVGGPPTVNEGSVTFTVTIGGSVQIGSSVTSGTVSGGSASATFTLPAGLALGTYSVSATYNPGPHFTGSSSDTSQTFQVIEPSLVVTTTADTPTSGQNTLREALSYAATIGTPVFTGSQVSSNIITLSSPITLAPGAALTYTTSGLAVEGLTNGSTYYAIPVSPTSFQLANSLSNALASMAINLNGSIAIGNQTLTPLVTFFTSTANGATNFSSGNNTIILGSTLQLASSVTITGPGAWALTVSGNSTCQVFNNNASGNTATISGMAIANGTTSSQGGGINNAGTLTVTNCTLSNNSTNGNAGGGIYNSSTGTLSLSNSTLYGNSSASFGGGIFNAGALTVTNSTFSGNEAVTGGGIQNDGGTLTVINSTFYENVTSGSGGGICVENGTATVTNCTISGNSGGAGGGIDIQAGTNYLGNSIVAGNTSGLGPDIYGAVNSQGHNLIGNGTGASGITNGSNGDQVGASASLINANLGPLANNGGPTQTMAFLAGSPAIAAGGTLFTLASTVGMNDAQFNLAGSVNPFAGAVGLVVQIGGEQMIVTGGSGQTVTVSRAANGTSAGTYGQGTEVNTAFDQRGPGFPRIVQGTVDIGAIDTATPTIGGTQQPASATVGTSIADQATVSGGLNPTGTVTFNLYNNSNGTSAPLFTDTETLSGGTATSAGYTTTATGTVYWVATYNGDFYNAPVATGTASEPVVVSAATPTLGTTPQPANANVGATIADQATVSGGFNPTGTVTFQLFNNSTGSGTPLFTDTETLSGGTATSNGYTTTVNGTDYWVATYNGDSNNNAVTSGAASEPVTVGTAYPTATQIGATATLNPQTGLFGMTVNVKNTTALAINGFRLHVNYSSYVAAYPSLKLYNATSLANYPDVYVDYPYPVAAAGTVAMNLEFYTSNRQFPNPFTPKLSVTTLSTSETSQPNPTGVKVSRIVMLANHTILLEFPSTVGNWYRISFSSNGMSNWYDSSVPIQASATQAQWIDNGAPLTDSPPSSVTSRFYYVTQIPAP